MGAVVQGAARPRSVRAEPGAHMGRAAHRAADLHGRAGGDTAVAGIRDDRPQSVSLSGGAVDRDAMSGDLHAHLVVVTPAVGVEGHAVVVERLALVGRLFGMQETRLDVLVVHRDEAVLGRAVDREEVDAVVMLADLVLLLGAGVGAGPIGRQLPGNRHAHRAQHLDAVPFRHDHRVLKADGDRREADQAGQALRQGRLARERSADEARGEGAQPPHQEPATGDTRLHHLIEVAVGRGVARGARRRAHAPSPGCGRGSRVRSL